MPPDLPVELLDKAARALYVSDTGMPESWDTESEPTRDHYRSMAEAALRAVLSVPCETCRGTGRVECPQQVGEILHALCSEEWMDPNDVMILAGASSEIARVEEVLQKDAGQ